MLGVRRKVKLRDVHNLVAGDAARRFDFVNKAGGAAEIYIYGPIGEDFFGEGISAKNFAKELKALGKVSSIDLHIDSPGGSVTDARAIYTQLVEHRAEINVRIDGYAASAASFIAMAGDEIAIAEGGFMMIHEARGVVRGTAGDLRKAATLLDSINATIADTYVARSKQTKKKVLGWMADETWFDGRDAVASGFADRILENKKLTACVSYPDDVLAQANFRKVPANLRPRAVRRRQVVEAARKVLEDA